MPDFRAWRDNMLIAEAGISEPPDAYCERLEARVAALKQVAMAEVQLRHHAEDRCVRLGIRLDALRRICFWCAVAVAWPCCAGLCWTVAVLAEWWRG
jgi:hypothetical protein